MQEIASKAEYLPTGEGLNPLDLLELFGEKTIILCAVAVWTRHTMTGNLEEKGLWINSFWSTAIQSMPEAVGYRPGWNTLFFGVPSQDAIEVAKSFSQLLLLHQDDCLTSFAVFCEAEGTARAKLDVLNALGHEIGSERSFGTSRSYLPDGGKFTHLLDGKPYNAK